LLDEKLELS